MLSCVVFESLGYFLEYFPQNSSNVDMWVKKSTPFRTKEVSFLLKANQRGCINALFSLLPSLITQTVKKLRWLATPRRIFWCKNKKKTKILTTPRYNLLFIDILEPVTAQMDLFRFFLTFFFADAVR